ncbi:hypothetical protein SRABI118_01452 [Massilia sp. Bi118]|uniref:hypothetical protein n=1 Tax=Massilia sp. Bi118 TaxID=2822346 RepID=UPI001DBC229A|nr:hypothetical protein [Massilia sp. Bi118]CAH0189416.1 hypothetical protein SRABI118_01452 [Massilia sp. Bi118]
MYRPLANFALFLFAYYAFTGTLTTYAPLYFAAHGVAGSAGRCRRVGRRCS